MVNVLPAYVFDLMVLSLSQVSLKGLYAKVQSPKVGSLGDTEDL